MHGPPRYGSFDPGFLYIVNSNYFGPPRYSMFDPGYSRAGPFIKDLLVQWLGVIRASALPPCS